MNKLLIVFLAVCLINVHAFVKRDAPADNAKNVIEDAKKFFEGVGDQLGKAFDPETVKKQVNEIAEAFNKVVDQIKPKDSGLKKAPSM